MCIAQLTVLAWQRDRLLNTPVGTTQQSCVSLSSAPQFTLPLPRGLSASLVYPLLGQAALQNELQVGQVITQLLERLRLEFEIQFYWHGGLYSVGAERGQKSYHDS